MGDIYQCSRCNYYDPMTILARRSDLSLVASNDSGKDYVSVIVCAGCGQMNGSWPPEHQDNEDIPDYYDGSPRSEDDVWSFSSFEYNSSQSEDDLPPPDDAPSSEHDDLFPPSGPKDPEDPEDNAPLSEHDDLFLPEGSEDDAPSSEHDAFPLEDDIFPPEHEATQIAFMDEPEDDVSITEGTLISLDVCNFVLSRKRYSIGIVTPIHKGILIRRAGDDSFFDQLHQSDDSNEEDSDEEDSMPGLEDISYLYPPFPKNN
jgi:hypothetical protein